MEISADSINELKKFKPSGLDRDNVCKVTGQIAHVRFEKRVARTLEGDKFCGGCIFTLWT